MMQTPEETAQTLIANADSRVPEDHFLRRAFDVGLRGRIARLEDERRRADKFEIAIGFKTQTWKETEL